MSMEIYLLTNERINSTKAWQDATDALGFDVRFLDNQPLQAKTTRIRAECRSKPVLMELEQVSLATVRDLFPDVIFPDDVTNVHALFWSKTLEGGLAAYQATAAYIGLASGLMIDTEEGKLNNPARAVELARDMAARMPLLEEAMESILAKMTTKPRN